MKYKENAQQHQDQQQNGQITPQQVEEMNHVFANFIKSEAANQSSNKEVSDLMFKVDCGSSNVDSPIEVIAHDKDYKDLIIKEKIISDGSQLFSFCPPDDGKYTLQVSIF